MNNSSWQERLRETSLRYSVCFLMISALGLHVAKPNKRLYKPQSSLLAWNSPGLRLSGHAQMVVIHFAFAFSLSPLKTPAGPLTPDSPTSVGLEPGPHFVVSLPSLCVPPLFLTSIKLSLSLWPVTLFLRFTSWHAHSWGLSRFIALPKAATEGDHLVSHLMLSCPRTHKVHHEFHKDVHT